MKKRKTILMLLLAFAIYGNAQAIRIQGSVYSENENEPLIGVKVMVAGTNTATVTDINGKYSIEASGTAVLQFSYVGYEPTEVSIGNRTTIDVTLKPMDHMFDDVVVMGYSTTRRAELSSAVVTIDAEKLHDVTSPDLGNLLQGKISGLMIANASGQPGANAELRIRGTGSITAEATPLFVVDGVPGGSFNPNDVETITVLKDAGATAIYGADGAGGVIVVTTKQAKRNQPTTINLKTTFGQKTALHGKFEMMNGKELYNTHEDIFSPALFKMQRPEELLDMNFDWLNAAFKPGFLQNYYISAAGTTDRINYFASTDYYQEAGTLINTNYKRITGRLNLNAQLNEKVNLGVRLNYSTSNSREASSYIVLEGAYRQIPWDIPYDDEGNLVKIDSDTRPDNGKKWYTQDKRNFLHGEQYNYARSRSYGFNVDVVLNWNILDWLTFTSTNRHSSGNYKYKRFIDPRTTDPSWSNGYTIENIGMYGSISTTNLLKANRDFGAHTLSGLLGYETGKHYSDYTSAAGVKMPSGVDGLSASTPQDVDGYKYPGSGFSIFTQLQYSYLNRYFLTASFRADNSSKFSKNYPTGYFPGASAAWLISEESFLKNNALISFLKLRTSFGATGNSNIAPFQSLAMYMLNTSYQDQVGAVLEREANPNLTWETAYMSGLGLDLSLWNRLHFNVDIYNIDNKNLLLNVPRSPSTGFEYGLQNIGHVRNRGVELQIQSDNIKRKDFTWSTLFNIGINQNKVIALPNGAPIVFTAGSSSIAQELREGQDINSWYMPKWMGVDPDNGDPLWEKLVKDADGNITDRQTTNDYTLADQQVVGKATPKFSGGMNNSLKYMGFGLDFQLNFVYGNSVYNSDRESYDSDGAYLGYNMMRLQKGWKRWYDDGDQATHPKLVMNGNKNSNKTSSRYLEDGSFLRVRNVTLSYTLPADFVRKIKLKQARIFLSGDNLFTFTKFSGLDPEVSLQNSQWSLAGMYSFNYPISRQFLIGFDIYF